MYINIHLKRNQHRTKVYNVIIQNFIISKNAQSVINGKITQSVQEIV